MRSGTTSYYTAKLRHKTQILAKYRNPVSASVVFGIFNAYTISDENRILYFSLLYKRDNIVFSNGQIRIILSKAFGKTAKPIV